MFSTFLIFLDKILIVAGCLIGLISLNMFAHASKQKKASLLMVVVAGISFLQFGLALAQSHGEAHFSSVMLWVFIMAASGFLVFWFLNSLDEVDDLDLLPLTMTCLAFGNAFCAMTFLFADFQALTFSSRFWFYLTIILGMNGASLGVMCFFRRVKIDWNPPHPQLNPYFPILIVAGFIGQLLLTLLGANYGWSFIMAPIIAFIGWNLGIIQHSASRRTDLRYLIPWLMFVTCFSTTTAAFAYGNTMVATIISVVSFMQFELWMQECLATHVNPWHLFLGRYKPVTDPKNLFFPKQTRSPVNKEEKGEKSLPFNIQLASPTSISHWIEEAEKIVIIPGEGALSENTLAHLKHLVELLQKDEKRVSVLIHPDAGHQPKQLLQELVKLDLPSGMLIDELQAGQDKINDADLAVVLGGNDIINPTVSLTNPYIPYDLQKLKHIIILKRSLNPGEKNKKNPVFSLQQTAFLLGTPHTQLELINNEIEKSDAGLSVWNYVNTPENNEDSV